MSIKMLLDEIDTIMRKRAVGAYTDMQAFLEIKLAFERFRDQ